MENIDFDIIIEKIQPYLTEIWDNRIFGEFKIADLVEVPILVRSFDNSGKLATNNDELAKLKLAFLITTNLKEILFIAIVKYDLLDPNFSSFISIEQTDRTLLEVGKLLEAKTSGEIERYIWYKNPRFTHQFMSAISETDAQHVQLSLTEEPKFKFLKNEEELVSKFKELKVSSGMSDTNP